MLTYTPKLAGFVRKALLPKLCLDSKSRISMVASFARGIPYPTDIDAIADIHKNVKPSQVYDRLLTLLNSLPDMTPKTVLWQVTCGFDDRYLVNENTMDELTKMREMGLLDEAECIEYDKIMKFHETEPARTLFLLGELFHKHYKLRWTQQEIIANLKTLPGGLTVTLTETIEKNDYILCQFYVTLGRYPIGVDFVNYYRVFVATPEYYSKVRHRMAQKANYAHEWYYMLFPLRKYFRSIRDNKSYSELDDIIEKKYGKYKQLMTRIDTYHNLAHTSQLTNQEAATIAMGIAKDAIALTKEHSDGNKFHSATLDKFKIVSKISDNKTRLQEWYMLLWILYDDLNDYVGELSKPHFFNFLARVPVNQQPEYYMLQE